MKKILQPFLTTMSTAYRAEFGMSLNDDIIKAHGGKFKVETDEGLGTTFIILFPMFLKF